MKIGLIQNGVCRNIVVFDTVQDAQTMLGPHYDTVVECDEGMGIGDFYRDNCWQCKDAANIEDVEALLCPVCGTAYTEGSVECSKCGYSLC